MSECVSCGKEIPAGKFFCDECYVKMKGRRGTLQKVPQTPVDEQGSPGEPAGAAGAEAGEPSSPAGVEQTKKASGTLTPTSGKKVVSMKPDVDKGAREKGKAGKKRFTVTISFSERTYAALARFKRKREDAGEAGGQDVGVTSMQPAKTPARRKGLYGRPKLKAVTAATGRENEHKSGFGKVIAYRDRAWDKGDIMAIAMATIAFVLIIAMSFMNWVKLSWAEGEAAQVQTVYIKGVDLGAIFYLSIAVVAVAYLYMVATWVFKKPFTRVDYGVIFIVSGLVFIPLAYASIASIGRLFDAAYRILGAGGGSVPEQYQRNTLLPAYIVVLMGAVFAIAGLVRLSERRIQNTQG